MPRAAAAAASLRERIAEERFDRRTHVSLVDPSITGHVGPATQIGCPREHE
jgi:hypothetical protein